MPGIRVLGRRLRQSFGISAPKVAIRPKLSWRWKLTAIIAATALIVGMWWWGFDFGQFLGGFDHRATVEERARLDRLGRVVPVDEDDVGEAEQRPEQRQPGDLLFGHEGELPLEEPEGDQHVHDAALVVEEEDRRAVRPQVLGALHRNFAADGICRSSPSRIAIS